MSQSTPERFHEIDALFEAALDLPEAESAGFLDRACAGDAELRNAVERLLLAHRRSAAFLESPALEVAAPLLAGSELLAPRMAPARVGAFRVVRAIGRGGMGVVYLGERDDGQFRQRVALKLVGRAGDEPELARRFLEERRILALLEHPRIARLIDGGVTDDGQPYFAMEYVEGEPIDRYCDARALGIEPRLALFGAVCDAVHYAHQHLVVHRDLKPSNILVTAAGELKLLDFGIAKLIDPLAADGVPPATRSGLHPMTPEYAAPEQVRGEPVSTATDVYALGVLLYLLLTGQRPYEVRGRTPAEIERIVCTLEPPRPATMFATGPDAADRAARARARGATPERLRRRLRGDLELIVMKALRKEPDRRYPSAAALGEDIERLRAGQPVRAAPDGAGYRMRRFVGRHRAGVAAASLLALLVGGAAVRERDLRAQAEAEARKAHAVQEYIVSVFDVADPFGAGGAAGAEVTARELLDRGAARVDSVLSGQQHVQAELRGVLGRVYRNLGLLEPAVSQLEEALAQRRALYGMRHPAVAEAMDLLGMALLDLDRMDDAEPLLREALALRRRTLGDRHLATAESLNHLATLLQERTRYDDAEPLFREVLDIRRELLGMRHPDVALAFNNLGLLLWLKGAPDAAEPLYRQAVDIAVQTFGENHAQTAKLLGNLAQVQHFRGEMDEAESLYRRALAAKRRILGDAHPSVTIGLNNLGIFLAEERDRLDEGEALIREALVLDRRIFGEQHAYVAESLNNLGLVLGLQGDLGEAERIHREALAMRRSLLGERHAGVARGLRLVANARHVQGDVAAAERLYREALERYGELLGDGHPNYLTTAVGLARALRELGRLDEAERLFAAAAERLDPTKPRQLTSLVSAQVGLGLVWLERGRLADALPLLEAALDAGRDRLGDDHWRTAEARLALGMALAAAGDHVRAGTLLRAADAALRAQAGVNPHLASLASAASRDFHARHGRVMEAGH